MTHLSDIQIQSVLDDSRIEEYGIIERHLAECDECRLRLLFYMQLGKAVGVALREKVPDYFETTVMTKINAIRRARRISDISTICIGLAGLALIALMFFLSTELREVLSFYVREGWRLSETGIRQVASTSDFIAALCSAILLILFFGGLDRLLVSKLRSAPDRNSSSS